MGTYFKTGTCKHCGQPIYCLGAAGPWIHLTNYSVDCQHSEMAEPEDQDYGHCDQK